MIASRSHILPAALPAANGSGIRVLAINFPAIDLTVEKLDLFLRLLALRVPIYGEDSPALLRPVLRDSDLLGIYSGGARWATERLQLADELQRVEADGVFSLPERDLKLTDFPEFFVEQGRFNFGILEAGNHFIELQVVDQIRHPEIAAQHNLEIGQLLVMIHDGNPASLAAQYFIPSAYAKAKASRAFEKDKQNFHRPLDHASRIAYFEPAPVYFGIERESSEAVRFNLLMAAACNFGLANRVQLGRAVIASLRDAFGTEHIEARLLTDTLHDCLREIDINGTSLLVHRHGATEARPASAYPAGHPFAETGQLVAMPGAPGRPSYLCAAQAGTRQTYYSANHGAGRLLDRGIARNTFTEDEAIGEVARSGANLLRKGLGKFAGEDPRAYKDVDSIAAFSEKADLVKRVAYLRPLAIYKG